MPQIPNRQPDGYYQLTGPHQVPYWDMGDHFVYALKLKDSREIIVAETSRVAEPELAFSFLKALLDEYAPTPPPTTEGHKV